MRSAFPARPHRTLRARAHTLSLGERTVVMAILNCTPDSFSDGGRHEAPTRALERLEQFVDEGADWVDVGGESTRPNAPPVPWEEEWQRIAPVLEQAARGYPLPISVDTTKSEVAERALDLGASILNDVSGLRFDPRLADLAAESGAALILMHMRGNPRTMQISPEYHDVTEDVASFLERSIAQAQARGVTDEQIVIDPGIGFGKTAEHNFRLLAELPHLSRSGRPILVGASRKSFLGKSLGLEVDQRREGSLAAHVAAVLGGAHIVRAHDVRETVRAVRIADEILRAALDEA